ncbi:MAG TPA: hypothetical protein VFB82_00610 [Blastocatellia bacterium]|nr:hypothetical protein [Blastocatellia bacterium]
MPEAASTDITKKRVVYRIPGMDSVKVRRDIEYRTTEAAPLTMDVYYPFDWKEGEQLPAVVFVAGYSDVGFQRILGCKFKEMASYASWGQLTAASGMIAITYSAVEPEGDTEALLEYVRKESARLGIDENNIGIWACSGSVPNALSVLMNKDRNQMKCAVLCYGVMLDLEGYSSTAELAKRFGFVNACAGKSVNDLPPDLPLFIARAGQDEMPHLNETLDRFVAAALACNLPITVANHASAPHAFDVMDDSETSREIIKQILAFMRVHLLAAS